MQQLFLEQIFKIVIARQGDIQQVTSSDHNYFNGLISFALITVSLLWESKNVGKDLV